MSNTYIAPDTCIISGCNNKAVEFRLCSKHQDNLVPEKQSDIRKKRKLSNLEKLHNALKRKGTLTRADQHRLFGSSVNAEQLAELRSELTEKDIAIEHRVKGATKPIYTLILKTDVDEEDSELAKLIEEEDDEGTDVCDLCGAVIEEELCFHMDGEVHSNCPLLEQPVRRNRK